MMKEFTTLEKILFIFGLIMILIVCIGFFIQSNPCKGANPVYIDTPNKFYSFYAIPEPMIIGNNMTCIYKGVAIPNPNP